MKILKYFLVVLVLSGSIFAQLKDEDKTKIKNLLKENKNTEVLEIVNNHIKNSGETLELLVFKTKALIQADQIDEAITTAIKREKLNTKTSPWGCIEIMGLYLKKGNVEEADKWMRTSIKKGFITITEMDEEIQDLVKKMPAYDEYVKLVRENIGIGKPAKDFSISNVKGVKVELSALKGKVVLVDFWATWCPPCRKEMPNLIKTYDELSAKGLEIIGISLDNDKTKLDNYVKENNLKWQICFSNKAWDDETAKLYGVNSIPSVWLVDKKGNLRYYDVHGEDLKTKIEELIKE